MRNVLKYYYNFSFDTIEEHKEYAVISDINEIYIFKRFIGNIDDLKNICELLNKYNINAHKIVINKEQELLTKYNGIDYILIKLESTNEIVNDNMFNIITSKVNVDIPSLWAKHLDYYINQIKELCLDKELLIDSFNYYVGMGENAIAIYNQALKLNGELIYQISHKRIYYPNYAINYYDPTNMIIDERVRDISEYIKNKFFKTGMTILEFDSLISKYQFNNKEINILYARLFYPSYYFDLFDDLIVSEEDEKKIYNFLDKSKKYEEFLYNIYKHLKILNPVFEVEWIKPKNQL